MTANVPTRVEGLLLDWQEAFESGRDLPLGELCRDCPELLPELERQVGVLKRINALAGALATGLPNAAESRSSRMESTGAVDPLPAQLGGYRIVGLLGEGGMGKVLRAEDPVLRRHVALKVMRPELAQDEHARQRFLREARAAAALQHDNVVAVYQVGEEGGQPFIAMPLLVGESLEARLEREKRLPIAEVLRIGRESAQGLQAAHAAGLVHRDIKPANLWLEAPSGRVKILDFGLARPQVITDGLTNTGAVMGTPAYMSPEQVNGESLDARSDLFSLGGVLYRAATGKPPFEGKTLTAVLKAVAEDQPAAPHEMCADVPGALSELIMRLLAKRPEDRPATAGVVADQLAALASGSPGESTLPAIIRAPGQARLGVDRQRWLIAGTALVLFVVVGVIVWLFNHKPDRQTALNPSEADNGGKDAGPSEPTQPPVRYRGRVDVKVERAKRLLPLNEPGALPLRRLDQFVIEGEVDPPAYLYLVWVDPGKDVTPVYPWDPESKEGWGTRPTQEKKVARVRLPWTSGDTYRAKDAKPGVATMVLFARPTPLDVPDDEVRKWFEALPELPLPAGGDTAVMWFDDYNETKDPNRLRTFERVERDDPFARWQGQLQKVLGPKAAFQTAVSFARKGGN